MKRILITGVALGLVLPTVALADWQPGDGARIVRIDAENAEGSGHLQFVFTPQHNLDGTWTWTLPPGQENRAIRAGGDVLLTLEDLLLTLQMDPAVSLSFALTAGTSDTSVTISSATLASPDFPITNPDAFATAGVTVTDNNSNGATLTGLLSGGMAYEARYNNPAVTWASLVAQAVAGVDNTAIVSDREPGVGRAVIPATVNSIEAQFSFILSAGDSASGTSRFDVIPEPASAALLMLAGALALSARRRRPG